MEFALEPEQKFLHDISNPLSVGYGNLRLVVMKMKKDINSLEKDKILERLEKSLDAFDKATQLLSDRRTVLKTKLAEET